ncbi:MAG: hypothetical protein U5R31_16395 [Acidimicrobiia bacterium]|nr:hypothetical protein [Acidimicrobiia bacterium]
MDEPVGHLDVAPTLCEIAGVDVPDWMHGRPLPIDGASARDQDRQRVLTEWDSEFNGITHHLRTIFRDGWICTAYLPSNVYEGTEGELYRVEDDPHQRVNLWDDPAHRSVRDDLVADLHDHLPEPRAERLGDGRSASARRGQRWASWT